MNQNIVIETSRNLRALARVSLQGKWKLAATATAVYMIAMMVPATILDIIFGGEDGVSALSSLYTILVAGPFTVGYSMFCLNLFRRKECEVSQVFYGFERFGKAIGLFFVMYFFIILWALLFIIPGIIAGLRYSQAFLIMIDHPEYGIMKCIAESKRLMVGNKSKYFCMQLSFIGWGLLASIPAMILPRVFSYAGTTMLSILSLIGSVGYFWLSPYMSIAGVAFYELANGNLKQGVIEVDPIVVEEEMPKNNEDAFKAKDEHIEY